MRAEELIALASAHGIDLQHNIRLGAPPPKRDTVTKGHNGHRHKVLLEPSAMRARGEATRSNGRPAWTLQELGQAAAGVPRLPFLAACYCYAGDQSAYWPLWSALEGAAQELRARFKWPAQVRSVGGRPAFYLERLAQLILDEDSNQALFNAVPATEKHASLHAIYLQIEEDTWRRSVFERFDHVKMRFSGWVGHAMSMMQPRLEELADDGV